MHDGNSYYSPSIPLRCAKNTSGRPRNSTIEPLFQVLYHTDPFHTGFHTTELLCNMKITVSPKLFPDIPEHIGIQMRNF